MAALSSLFARPVDVARRQLTLSTHRIHTLPIVILMPHSACNCRCVMCDIWKANQRKRELTAVDIERNLHVFRAFDVRWVVLSGGEALLHSNLWTLCDLLRETRVRKITLLSTGLLLERHAEAVVAHCDEVTVSLDGSREVHDRIRRVPRAFERLSAGVAALKAARPGFRVTARCVLQRQNFADLPEIVRAAHDIGLDQVSFLAADVSSEAFNRPEGWSDEQTSEVALSREEVASFTRVVEDTIERYADDFSSGFVAESPDKLRRLPRYYAALLGDAPFPGTHCNAPWVSTVVEADGTVRPCFFHRPLGNIHEQPLDAILNGDDAVAFRRDLDVSRDPTCQRCVCTLHVGSRATLP